MPSYCITVRKTSVYNQVIETHEPLTDPELAARAELINVETEEPDSTEWHYEWERCKPNGSTEVCPKKSLTIIEDGKSSEE